MEGEPTEGDSRTHNGLGKLEVPLGTVALSSTDRDRSDPASEENANCNTVPAASRQIAKFHSS